MGRQRRAWRNRRTAAAVALSAVAAAALAAVASLSGSASADFGPGPLDNWQVVTHLGDSQGLDVLVWDFAELDGVMYVAGSFGQVRSGPGAVPVDQPYLAAFDVDTGEWIDAFRPVLDGAVFTVEAAADGSHVLAGGEFDGGLVALDPATGERYAGWSTTISHRWSAEAGVMDIEPDGVGGWYIGGNFSHVDDGDGDQRRRRLARLDADGRLDPDWQPAAQGGRVWAVVASKTQPWVHVSGRFVSMHAEPDSGYFATVDATDGALVPGVPHGLADGIPSSEARTANQKIYAMAADEDALWIGGEPHVLVELDPVTLETRQFWFANRGLGDAGGGGDFQAIALGRDRVWAGCHCWGSVGQYEPLAPQAWTFAAYGEWLAWFAAQPNPSIRGAFAVDRNDGRTVETFSPDLTGDDGVWAIIEDSNGVVWFGGEFTSASGAYPGGFVRYAGGSTDATPIELVGDTSPWSWWHDPVAPPAGWTDATFDASAWPVGSGHFGFGDGDETTFLDPGRWTRSAYFRTTFAIVDAVDATELALDIVADDGYVVWLNGTEIGRDGVGPGPVGHTRWATRSLWGAAENAPVRIPVDPGLLVDGPNALAVQVANGNTGDIGFAATLRAAADGPLLGEPPPPPPSTPPPPPPPMVAAATNAVSVELRWYDPTASSVAHYEVRRDGAVIGTGRHLLNDRAVTAGDTHVYDVVAVGADGQRSEPSHPVTVTVGTNTYDRRHWVRHPNVTWRWTDAEPGPGWLGDDFDDRSWKSGLGRVGHRYSVNTDTGPATDLWLRSTVTVPAWASDPEQVMLWLERDDAVVVYLNGHEVYRDNLATGPVTAATEPLVNLHGGALQTMRFVMVPGELVRPGVNTIAVRLVNARGSNDLRVRLGMLGYDYDDPAHAGAAPTAPTGLVARADAQGVVLTWEPATDDGAVTGYVVERDGETVGTAVAPRLSFFDPAPVGEHSYRVVAVDQFGARSPASAASTAAVPEPPPPVPPALAPDVCTATPVAGQGVVLRWGLPGATVTVRRNGAWLATTTDGAGTATDPDAEPGDTYQVRNYGAGGRTVDCIEPETP